MKKMIIIGAGVAGLSTGIYACKNGYSVTIYESHYLPGGMCTAWKRKDYLFEGCLHYIWLTGSSPNHIYYQLWKELGITSEIQTFQPDIFHTFRDKTGRTLNLYTDVNRLQKELISHSPQDTKEIKALCKAVKRFTPFIRSTGRNPFLFLARLLGILRAIPFLIKYGSLDLSGFAARFKDPLIRYAFTYLFIKPEFACTSVFFILAGFSLRGNGYPRGGSLALAKAIASQFLTLKGKIQYKTKVKRIIIEADKATAVELEDGTIKQADIIVSAADGHTTLFTMLEDKYSPPVLRERFSTAPLYTSFIQVSFGVNREMCNEPHTIKAETARSFEIAGKTRQVLWYQHFSFDPDMAPRGKAAITVLYPSTLSWWEKLGYNSEEYKAEKKKILDTTTTQLEQFLPGIESQIEVSDVATPFTILRYTHNWKAAPGFLMTKTLAGEMTLKPRYTLPGLAHFYMTGQWVKGFGLPMAAMCGKEVIREICKNDKRKFRC